MKMLMIAILLCFSTTQLRAEDKSISYLKSKRDNIKFVPLNNEERFAVIRHSKILFSKLYVNLEHKMALYEKFRPLKDLNTLEQSYQNMTDIQFHQALITIFNSSHDYHVNYNLPKPYACYVSFLPISFRKTGTKKIIVNSTNPKLKELFPDISKFSPGDELISYNKMSPKDYIESRKDIVATPTPDSALMQGIFDLYYRNLGGAIAPQEDMVEIKIKKVDGTTVKSQVPWMVQYSESCVNPPVEQKAKVLGAKASKLGAPDIQMFKERRQFLKEMRKNFLSFFKKKALLDQAIETADLSNANKTNHPDLWWKKINWKNQNLGWLQLTSFDAPKGVRAAVAEVKAVVEKNLSNTSAIVIDLRGNYGGQIAFAEEMAALFNPRPVRYLPFYIRANDLTLALYDSDLTWKDLILPYVDTNKIVGPGAVSTEAELVGTSQAYFGKVVLLTNSECFSSCDLFSASMKDNNHATIYGTDRSTMGGGANVWPLEFIQEVFNKLNIPASLPQNISMRITGRHAHRLSSNALIEDAGVPTDIIVNETDADIIDPDHSSIVAKIFNDLVETPGPNSNEITLNLAGDTFQRHGDEALILSSFPSMIDQIAVYKNNKFIRRYYVDASNKLEFYLDAPAGKFGQDSFIIYGFSKNAETKFPILRRSIVTESLGAYAPIDTVDPIANAVMTNNSRIEKCNWIKSDNSLVLAGPYCPESKLEAVESLDVSEGHHSLSFDMILDAEPTYDFFDITVIADGSEQKLMAPVSDPINGHFEYDLSKYAGKKIDIRFRLTSDEAGSGNGVTISNLKIN